MGLKRRTTVAALAAAATMTLAACGTDVAGDPLPRVVRNGQAATAGAGALTPVVASVVANAAPVQGSDGQAHLAYELLLQNTFADDLTVSSVEVVDAADPSRVVARFAGADLAERLIPVGPGTPNAVLSGGRSMFLLVAATAPRADDFPKAFTHRVTIEVPQRPTGPILPPTITELVGEGVVSGKAVTLGAPLKGSGWVAAGGCCDRVPHRMASFPFDGTRFFPERFAIDWVQIDDRARSYDGDVTDLDGWVGFGAEIISVADGTVVSVVDDLPEQVPPSNPSRITLEELGGNHVVVDIGGGRYAFFAHMQPGSIRVTPGQRVSKGEVLGLLGNSGNSSAPHLHFHVSDAPTPVASNSVPYQHETFSVEGRVVDDETTFQVVDDGGPLSFDRSVAGPRTNELPMSRSVVTFPS